MEEVFSHLDLQTEALKPRDNSPSVTIVLRSSFLLQVLFFSTIFEISANKFLSTVVAQGIKLYNQKKRTTLNQINSKKRKERFFKQISRNPTVLKAEEGKGREKMGNLESVDRIPKRGVCITDGISKRKIKFIIRTVVAVPVEAIAPITPTFLIRRRRRRLNPFKSIFLNEILHHFVQTYRAGLKLHCSHHIFNFARNHRRLLRSRR